MAQRKPGGSAGPTIGVARPEPALPAWKAFVVQFSRETKTGAQIFAGRVEHLSSGRRVRFESADELVIIMRELLDDATAPVE